MKVEVGTTTNLFLVGGRRRFTFLHPAVPHAATDETPPLFRPAAVHCCFLGRSDLSMNEKRSPSSYICRSPVSSDGGRTRICPFLSFRRAKRRSWDLEILTAEKKEMYRQQTWKPRFAPRNMRIFCRDFKHLPYLQRNNAAVLL